MGYFIREKRDAILLYNNNLIVAEFFKGHKINALKCCEYLNRTSNVVVDNIDLFNKNHPMTDVELVKIDFVDGVISATIRKKFLYFFKKKYMCVGRYTTPYGFVWLNEYNTPITGILRFLLELWRTYYYGGRIS